jgi:hypothetical protein
MPPCIGKLPKSKINWDDWRHYNNNNNKLNQNQRVGTMMSNNVFLIETLDYNNNNNKNYNFASHDKNIWFGWWGNKIFYNFWTIKLLLEPNSLELFWLFIFIFKCIINLLDCSYVKRTLTLVPYHNELWFLFFTFCASFIGFQFHPSIQIYDIFFVYKIIEFFLQTKKKLSTNVFCPWISQ